MPACTPEEGQQAAGEAVSEDDLSGTYVYGRSYYDADGSDESTYAASYDADNDDAVVGQEIRLIGASGTQTTSTDASGSFAFDDLADGAYVLAADHPEGGCKQRNCIGRFAQAIEEGSLTMVTFGDSVPKVGDAPMFPSRLASLIGDLAEVDNRNVAVPGSISTQWLPGTNFFENELRPNIADADVIIVSVGGNDITQNLGTLGPEVLMDIQGAIDDTYELVTEIVENIREIATEIRSVNPDVDIVYCLYVDYGTASMMPWGLASTFLPAGTVTGVLESARSQVPDDENIILADLFGASLLIDVPLDDYLYDALHFNDDGQTFYAQEVFQSLGGVLVGDSPLGGSPSTPLNTRPSFSYSASASAE
jgi:lysophospholipase L1-like esterase